MQLFTIVWRLSLEVIFNASKRHLALILVITNYLLIILPIFKKIHPQILRISLPCNFVVIFLYFNQWTIKFNKKWDIKLYNFLLTNVFKTRTSNTKQIRIWKPLRKTFCRSEHNVDLWRRQKCEWKLELTFYLFHIFGQKWTRWKRKKIKLI